MKKKILLILPVLILVIALVIITTNTKKNTKIDFNTDLEISTIDTKINSDIKNLSNDKYEIDAVKIKTLTNEEEEKILEVANNITLAFNKIDHDKYVYEVEKYAVRQPNLRIDKDTITNEDYKEWFDNIISIEVYANFFRGRNATYEALKSLKISYASTERTIVKAFIDNYKISYGTQKYTLDAIFEYVIVFEESSQMYKVKSMTIEWVSDLQKYYQKMEKAERNQNKNNAVVSNTSTYIPEGYTNFDYTKLKAVTQSQINDIYEKNKDSVVIIDSVSEGGVSAGSSSGFYIRKGVVVTSYNSVYSMIENRAARYYAVDNSDKTNEIEGIIAAYPELNIVILKLKEEIGTPVELGDSSKLEKNDPVAVISSALGLKSSIKLGIYFDYLKDDYKVLRTALPLIDGDSGSAVFNLDGEVIAINTSVSTSNSQYNSGLNNAIDISIIFDTIGKLRNEQFNKIDTVKFNEFNVENEVKVINKVNEKVWEKYEELPVITKQLPLNLYSAYQTDNYIIVRYKQNKYTALTNTNVIDLYKKHLTANSYEEEKDNVYKKDNITIRLQNNLGYIIIIVEGVV